MIHFAPGTDASLFLSLNDGGIPIVGGTVTASVYGPDGSLILSTQPQDLGNGSYRLDISGSLLGQSGSYRVVWQVTAPIQLRQEESFWVGPRLVPAYTVREMRQSIGRLVLGLDGFALGTVQSGGTDWLADPSRLEPDRHWRGAWCIIASGAQAGRQARVTDYTQATSRLSLAPPFASSLQAGDRYELHRFFSQDDYLDAIRLAVQEVAFQALQPVLITSTIQSHQYEYDIAGGLSHIFEVRVQEQDGRWRPIAPGAWEVRRADRRLVLHPHIVQSFANRPLRIGGLRPPHDPVDDESVIDVRPACILYLAASHLCRRMSGDDWQKRADIFFAQGQAEKALLPRIPQNTRRIE